MDHGEGDWERPIVKLLIEDVFIVNDDGEAEEYPDADVGVREDDVLDDIVAQRTTFAHCCVVVLFLSGFWEDREMREMVNKEEEEEEGVRGDCGEVGERNENIELVFVNVWRKHIRSYGYLSLGFVVFLWVD